MLSCSRTRRGRHSRQKHLRRQYHRPHARTLLHCPTEPSAGRRPAPEVRRPDPSLEVVPLYRHPCHAERGLSFANAKASPSRRTPTLAKINSMSTEPTRNMSTEPACLKKWALKGRGFRPRRKEVLVEELGGRAAPLRRVISSI